MSATMRVLTLTQPWAQLVALGAKRIETRSWTTSYRGPLAIQAGVGLGPVGGMRGLEKLCLAEPFASALENVLTKRYTVSWPGGAEVCWGFMPSCVTLGAIVAVCELANVIPTEHVWFQGDPVHTAPRPRGWLAGRDERAFGDYSPGRFAWLLRDVRRLERPVAYRNGHGLRRLDEAQVTASEVAGV